MTNADLQNKLSEILGIKEGEKNAAWSLFREKTTEILEFYDALKIDGLGVFQLKSKAGESGLTADTSGEALIFAPDESSGLSGKAWLTIDLPEAAKDSQELDESVFSLGINKTTEESYLPSEVTGEKMIRKDLEERVVELISSSEFIDSYDIWRDKIAKVYSSPAQEPEKETVEPEEPETEEPEAEEFSFDLDDEESPSGNLKEEDNIEIKKALEEEADSFAETEIPREENPEIIKPDDKEIFKDFNFEDFTFEEEKKEEASEEPEENKEEFVFDEKEEKPAPPPLAEEPETTEEKKEEEDEEIDFFDLNDIEDESAEEDFEEESAVEEKPEEPASEPWDWAADDETISEEEEIINDVYGTEEETEELPEDKESFRFQRVTAEDIGEEPEVEKRRTKEEIFAGVPSEEELESGVETGSGDKWKGAYSDFDDLEGDNRRGGPPEMNKKSSLEKEAGATGRGFKKGIWVFFFLVFLIAAAALYYFLWYVDEVDSPADNVQENVSGQLEETPPDLPDTAVSDNLAQTETEPEETGTQAAGAGISEPQGSPEPVMDTPRTGERELYINLKSERMVENLVYSDGNNYYVQMHSFRTSDQAERVARSLRREGQMAFIMRTYVPKLDATYNRVVIGEFKTIEEARQYKRSQRL